jgi:dTDP-4-dehydrorhamnose reductase
MLGTDVCARFAAAGHQVTPVTREDFDIADHAATRALLFSISPDLVIHTAAETDVDGCERDPDNAYRINALGSWNVASACASLDVPLAAISTDFVFDGRKTTPYTEFDTPNPLGVYGASKLAGEQMVRQTCPKHYIVRTSWLYGVHGKCFPKAILRAAQTRSELSVVADQTGVPTYVVDLADALLDLIETPLYGIYHLASGGECTWHEFAQSILSESGTSGVAVKPIKSEEWPSPTRRPKYSVLRPYVQELMGKAPMRPWREGLKDFLTELASSEPSSPTLLPDEE